jgi:FMN phosphatase YigB (HAD superfamily)
MQPLAPSPRLILFDLDDTLCDYASARDLRLRLAFTPHLPRGNDDPDHGAALERMVADSLATHPHGADHFPALFPRHGIHDPAAAESAMRWYRSNRFHGLTLFDDAIEVVGALRPGRRVGLVTNGPTDVQRAKIARLGVERLVDFLLISEEFGAWKPDPAIFHEAMRQGGAGPDDAVFIGDSAEHDMAGARAVGIRTIWMNRHRQPWSHSDPAPDHEVVSLTELRALLGDHP